MPDGDLPEVRREVCAGCSLDTYLHLSRDGWRCPDCGHLASDTPRTRPERWVVDPGVIFARVNAGETFADLAREHGCGRHTIRAAYRRAGGGPLPVGRRPGFGGDYCRAGLHAMTSDNVYTSGGRRCRQCQLDNVRARRHAAKAAA